MVEAPVPGVVLAGGKAKPDLQAVTGQAVRALVPVNGKTLLRHAVDALRAAELLGPITVVGDVPESEDYRRISDSGDFVGNVFAGVSAYAEAPFVLISTSDLPFLTAEVVTSFVRGARERAQECEAGFVWPVVPVEACLARFPGVRRTSLRLREGEFTGGNLMLVRPDFVLARRQRIADAYAARKSPVRLARMLGMGTLSRLLLSQKVTPRLLTLSFLEERITRLLGSPARALVCAYPELATDLDRPSDFAAVGLPQGDLVRGIDPRPGR